MMLVLASLGKLRKENNKVRISIGDLKSSDYEDKFIKKKKELKNSNFQLQTHKKFKFLSVS